MRRLAAVTALAALLGVSACVTPETYRDPGAGISSTTRFDLARMQGAAWQVVARFGDHTDPSVRQPERYLFTGTTVHRTTPEGTDTLPVTITGPGRMEIGTQELWVLWVDDGFRTAALGHPSGAYGWIMQRGALRADQRQAARDILDWAGYDLTRLVEVTR